MPKKKKDEEEEKKKFKVRTEDLPAKKQEPVIADQPPQRKGGGGATEEKEKPEPQPSEATKIVRQQQSGELDPNVPVILRDEKGEARAFVRGGKIFAGSRENVEETAKTILGRQQPIAGAVEATEAIAQRERQKEALKIAEETGVFEERPEKVELDVSKEEKQVLKERERFEEEIKSYQKYFGSSRKESMRVLGIEKEEMELEDLIENPETARQHMLQEIQREELNRFKTSSQKAGEALEPWVGDLKIVDVDIGGYADKFTRMPKQESEEIVSQLKETEGILSGMTDAASQGELGNPNEVLRDIGYYEEDIYRLEARLKVLILSSPELRANPEKVNEIETQVQSIKETLFETKQRAAEGALITPTNEQLYFKLKNVRRK